MTPAVMVPASRVRERLIIRDSVSPVIRWAFYAFVFSLLFEAVPFGFPIEMTQITGGCLAIAAFIRPQTCLRRTPKAFWCFVAYIFTAVLSLMLHGALFDGEVVSRLLVTFQLMFMFCIAFNLMRHERVARGALKSFVAACAVFSVISIFGLTPATPDKLVITGRFTAYGLDPNQLAALLSLGVLTLIGFTYGLHKRLLRPRSLMWPALLLVGITIVRTGSRGGLLALGVGLWTFVLRKGPISAKIRNTLLVLVAIGFFVCVSYQSDVLRERFETTIANGDTTGRTRVYSTALDMFVEKPLIGWGPVLNKREIEARVAFAGYPSLDAHNLIFYVLTATGLIGAIPFFIGTGLCARSAWKARDGIHGILPFAMVISTLTACMSVSGLDWKHFWLVLAYALASSSQLDAVKLQHTTTKPYLPADYPDHEPVAPYRVYTRP